MNVFKFEDKRKRKEQLQAEYGRRLRHCRTLAEGNSLHQQIVQRGLENNRFLSNLLVSMYSSCGSLQLALTVFDKIDNKNKFSWNIIIAAYAHNGYNDEAIAMFWKMQLEGVRPDNYTLSTVLDACSTVGAVSQGQTLHSISRDLVTGQDLVLTNALIDFYGRNGLLDTAKDIFDRFPARDTVSWTCLLGSYAQHGHCRCSLDLFYEMQLDGVFPDRVTFLNVFYACSQGGFYAEGMSLFASASQNYGISRSCKEDSCMADLLGRAGMVQQAEQLIHSLEFQDVVCWTSLLNACKVHGDAERGARVAKQLLRVDSSCDSAFVMLSSFQEVIK